MHEYKTAIHFDGVRLMTSVEFRVKAGRTLAFAFFSLFFSRHNLLSGLVLLFVFSRHNLLSELVLLFVFFTT